MRQRGDILGEIQAALDRLDVILAPTHEAAARYERAMKSRTFDPAWSRLAASH